MHELIPSSLSNASFLERNKQAARAVPPRTDVRDYFHLAASLYALWRIPADVECYLLSSPATASTDTSLPQLYVSIPISCLAVFPFLLLTSVTLLEKRVALEVTALQNLFATSEKHENRPAFLCGPRFTAFTKVLLRAMPGYLNLETQSQSDTCTDGVGM